MKLFGFFAAFAAAQDFSVLTAAAGDLDKIVSSATGNLQGLIETIAEFDFEKPKECDNEKMNIADGVACVQKGFAQVFKFGSETIAATAEKFIEDGTIDRIVERAEQMKQNLKDAGFDVEYDPENTYEYKAPEYNTDYKFDSESVKESMKKVDEIIKEATKSFSSEKDEL
ncbi:unnamed protein product [Oikopleura dioica]|uniref:Uncharacterized protein n=1 Tax=Oikopleura dioica TaxID=34765 RepID=E4YU04_OIKDI|nr:unnamed protein product [Oikopleura dioica]